MLLTATVLLLLCALGLTVATAMGKAPLWPAVLFVIVVQLLQVVPIK